MTEQKMASKYEVFLYAVFLTVIFGFIFQFVALYLLSSDFYTKISNTPGEEMTTKRNELEQAQKLLQESLEIGENLKRILNNLRFP